MPAMVVSSGADPPPGTPPGDPGEYQHQKTTPGASAGLTQEKYDYLYQQTTVHDNDMMYTILNKCQPDTDINLCSYTTNSQTLAFPFHLESFKQVDGLQDIDDADHTDTNLQNPSFDDNDDTKAQKYNPTNATPRPTATRTNQPTTTSTQTAPQSTAHDDNNSTKRYKPIITTAPKTTPKISQSTDAAPRKPKPKTKPINELAVAPAAAAAQKSTLI